MTVRLRFEGIRCFSEPQSAAIRPITLLVGENSSGKTTFLALCQIAQAMAQGATGDLPFNKPPFSLGAYDQIASYRGGRAGRAKSFSLAIELDGENSRSIREEFVEKRGQPFLRSWRLTAGNSAFQTKARPGSDEYSILLEGPGGKTEAEAQQSFEVEAWPAILVNYDAVAIRDWIDTELGLSGATALTESDLKSLGNALKALREEFARTPYAFAPIRTSPQRTYDPVIAEPKPEGPHIPMLLAALSRSARKQPWAALQSALKDFGQRSGLFDGIEIVNKGRKESDPFQVGVKSGGPAFNLIDVGYGVSQALPILVDTLQRASGSEFFLLQQPEVHLHPRAQAELGSFFARQANKKRRFVIETHSDYLVDRIRMEVRRKRLAPHDVSLLYFERLGNGAHINNLELDKTGSIINPPHGFRQFFLNEERDLLGI